MHLFFLRPLGGDMVPWGGESEAKRGIPLVTRGLALQSKLRVPTLTFRCFHQ